MSLLPSVRHLRQFSQLRTLFDGDNAQMSSLYETTEPKANNSVDFIVVFLFYFLSNQNYLKSLITNLLVTHYHALFEYS